MYSLRGALNLFAAIFCFLIVLNYVIFRTSEHAKDELMAGVLLASLLLAYLFVRVVLVWPVERLGNMAQKIADGQDTIDVDQNSFQADLRVIANAIDILRTGYLNATDFVRDLTQGRFDASFKGLTDAEAHQYGLASALLALRARIKQLDAEERERNWATRGVAEFVEVLRDNNQDTEKLSQRIIAKVVQYLGANQGVLYVVDESATDTKLVLAAHYACQAEALPKEILPQEGLVGQSFSTGKVIHPDQLPANFLAVHSGLGEAAPVDVLVVPALFNEQVYAVMELASFHKLAPYQIEFMVRLGESVAVAIAGARNATRTQLLLAEMQSQAALLKAQEEQLKISVEQYQAAQTDLQRKVEEMERMKAEELKRTEILRQNQQKMLEKIIDKYKAQINDKEREVQDLRKQLEEASGGKAQA